jgi:hypothetical protein
MTTVTLRNKEYELRDFVLPDVFPYAYFLVELGNLVKGLNSKLTDSDYKFVACILKYKLIEDLPDELVDPSNPMGVNLEYEEHQEIYNKILSVLKETGRLVHTEIPEIKTEDKEAYINELETKLKELKQ